MPVAGEYPLFVFFVFLTQPHTRTGERKTGEEEGPVAASLQSRMEHPVSKAKDETREIIRKKGEYVYIYIHRLGMQSCQKAIHHCFSS